MKLINENAEPILTLDGREVNGDPATFGLLKRHARRMAQRGQTIRVTQLLKLVDTGLVTCKVFFRGLKRPCRAGENMQGDKEKRIYVLTTPFDYDYPAGRRFDGLEAIAERPAPDGRVFVVIASPNHQKDSFPTIDYWLEHWCWVDADPSDPTKPINFSDRYDQHLQ